MNKNLQYKTLDNAHFFDIKIKDGKRQVTVSAPNQRLVIQCLFKYLGHNKEAWPSQLQISIWCGFTSPDQVAIYKQTGKMPSLSTVKRILKALKEYCYIDVVRTKIGAPDARKTQNAYRIVWPNIAALNNSQSEFFFDEDQSSTPPDQSSTDRYQSSTPPDQSSTGGTLNTQPEPSLRNSNPKPQDSGPENWEQVKAGYMNQLEVASATDRHTEFLIEKFGLTNPRDVAELQKFVIEYQGSPVYGDAMLQAEQFIKQRSIPYGYRRLKAFKAIFERLAEEELCR